MKKLCKIIKIGFITFFAALLEYIFASITANKYPEFKQKSLELLKICFGIWLVYIIAMIIGNSFKNGMQEKTLYVIFIIFFASCCILLMYNMYIFFTIWHKTFKERWDKE
jgi:hypothetical protein